MTFFNEQETRSKVIRPEWTCGAGWEDISWHNDVMPKAHFEIGDNWFLEVLVNYPNQDDREFPEAGFCVGLVELEYGMSLTLYQGEDEERAKAVAIVVQRIVKKVDWAKIFAMSQV